MRAAYCLFSFAGDRLAVVESIKAIRRTDPHGDIHVFDDGSDPLPEAPKGVRYHRTYYNRRGNLLGTENLLGQLTCLDRVASLNRATWVCKVDCDTLVLNTDWKRSKADLVGAVLQHTSFLLGPFYAIRATAIPPILRAIPFYPHAIRCEDVATSGIARKCGFTVEDRGGDHLLYFSYRDTSFASGLKLASAVSFGNRYEIDPSEPDPRGHAGRTMGLYRRLWERGG